MIYKVPEITEFFNEETIHVLDYDCEYDSGYDVEKFPEYKNKVNIIWYRFGNSLIPILQWQQDFLNLEMLKVELLCY